MDGTAICVVTKGSEKFKLNLYLYDSVTIRYLSVVSNVLPFGIQHLSLLTTGFTTFFLALFFDPEDGGDIFLRNLS
jgi:hypothetical protein